MELLANLKQLILLKELLARSLVVSLWLEGFKVPLTLSHLPKPHLELTIHWLSTVEN